MAIETNLGNLPPIFAGEDRDLLFTVLNDSASEPIDISTWTLSFIAGPVSLTSAITLTNPTSGELLVPLSSTDTTSLTGENSWKLRRTDAGENTVLGFGTITVTA